MLTERHRNDAMIDDVNRVIGRHETTGDSRPHQRCKAARYRSWMPNGFGVVTGGESAAFCSYQLEWSASVKLFNSFQIVALFAAWPFFINWLQKGNGPDVAAYAACAVYVPFFIAVMLCVYHALDVLDQ